MPIRSLRTIAAGQRPVLFPAETPVSAVAHTMREREVSAAQLLLGLQP